MSRIILPLLLLIISLSCKKITEEEPVPALWFVSLSSDEGWFGESDIVGTSIYVLWNSLNTSGTSTKTQVYRYFFSAWTLLSYDPDLNFSGITFMDHSVGFLAGYRLIAKTLDGGQTWDTIGMGLIDFKSFYRLNPRIFGYGTGIYYSDDTAKTWVQVQPMTFYFTTMDFVDLNTGFTANIGGELYKSSDAGNSWQQVIELNNTEFYKVDFIDKTKGIALIGEISSPSQYPDMKLLYTEDGGESWSHIELGSHGISLDPESCCVFRDYNEFYLGGVNGIFYSKDKGMTWTTQYTEEHNNSWVRDINFTNGVGTATTGNGKVLRYQE